MNFSDIRLYWHNVVFLYFELELQFMAGMGIEHIVLLLLNCIPYTSPYMSYIDKTCQAWVHAHDVIFIRTPGEVSL